MVFVFFVFLLSPCLVVSPNITEPLAVVESDIRNGEWDHADRILAKYVDKNPDYECDKWCYKLDIASAMGNGARVHLFGVRGFPKWSLAYDRALEIYGELSEHCPIGWISANALYGKGSLLAKLGLHQESREVFLDLIERFHKHDLSADGFVGIAKSYYAEYVKNPSERQFVALAKRNLAAFMGMFPTHPNTAKITGLLSDMDSARAKYLLEISEFYSRTKKHEAAEIYKSTVTDLYPNAGGS